MRPKYSLAGKAPALKLTVTVEQSGVDRDFSVPVPVETVFTIPVRLAPSKVLLDPGNSVLAKR